MANKYWIANNPNAEVDNAQCIALKNLSSTDLTEIEEAVASFDELRALAAAIPMAAEADVAVTQDANPVSGNDAVTIVDGAAPTNDEIYELAIDTSVKLNALLAKLRTAGLLT